MNQPIKILILEDKLTDVEFIKIELNKSGMEFDLKAVNNKQDFINALDNYNATIILSNHTCKQFNSTEALEIIKTKRLTIPFILVTDSVNEAFAVKIIKLGADDYIVKNDLTRLSSAIEAALKNKQQELEIASDIKKTKVQQKKIQRDIALMETAIRVSKIGYWSWDIIKDEVFWSTRMYEIYDVNKKTFLKYDTVLSCIHPDDQQSHNDYVEEQINTKTHKSFQYRVLRKDNTIRHVEVELEVITNKKNEAIKLQGTVVDITEKREKEEALINSESKFRTLTSSAPVGIYQSNAAGKNSFVNEELMKYSGMTSEEATGLGWSNALHPDDVERVVKEWQSSVDSGKEFVSEYRLQKKTGTITWLYSKAVAIINKVGKTIGYIGVAIDITKRKAAEEKLKQSEELNRAIFNSKVIGFFYFDSNGEIIDANEFFLETVGYTKQDLLDGKLNWSKMTPPEYADRDQLALKELAETGICLPFEKVFISKDGREIPILIGGGMIQEKNTTKGYAYVMDITERLKAEKNIIQSEKKHRSLIEQALDGILKINEHGNITLANTAICKMLGYTEEEILKLKISDTYLEDEKHLVAERKKFVEAKGSLRLERIVLKKDGTRFPADISIKKIDDEQIVAIVRDMTEAKKTAEKLSQSQSRFQKLVNDMEVGVTIQAPDSKVLYCNEIAPTLLGLTKDQYVGKTAFDSDWNVTHEDGSPFLAEDFPVPLAIKTKKPISNVIMSVYRPINKDWVWLIVSAIPIIGDNGNVEEVVCSFSDITELKKAESEKEKLFKVIQKSQNEIYLFNAENLLYEYINIGALNNLGYTTDELYKMTPADIKPGFSDTEFKELLIPLLKKEKDKLNFETEHQRKNGSTYPIEVNLQLIDTNEGGVFLAVIQDITERKQSELIIEKSRQQLEFISNNIPYYIAQLNTDRKYLFVNKPYADLFQKAPEDFYEKCVHEVLGEEYYASVKSNMDLALKGEKVNFTSTLPSSYNFVNHNFEKITDIEINYIPEFSKTGIVSGYIVAITDITERKKAEEELQNTLRKLEEAQDISGLGHWEIDLVTNKRSWTKQIFKNFNFPVATEPPNRELVNDHIHPEDRSLIIDSYEKAKKGQVPKSFITRTNTEFGPMRYLLSNWNLKYDDAGNIINIFGTSQDVTEQLETEQKLTEQNKALQKANTELDRFVYSASHDLRAPLKSMLGLTDLLQIELTSDDSDQSMLIDMIKKSVLKLDGFIEDILDYSRNARIELHLENLNFDEIIEEIRGNHKFMDGAKDVVLNLDVQLESAFISDLSRVKIILNNLISNAVKYHDNKNNDSFVSIKIRCDKTKAIIEVTDNGIGIAQKDHEEIFKMFHRATNLSTGSGLGLYIVSEALEKLGGTIKLESELGKGSKFSLSIPNNI